MNFLDFAPRRGERRHPFPQLSFGQKSAIILILVLVSAGREVTLIDQPEDRLDAYSIVNIVVPTLNWLARDHQVILAMHSTSFSRTNDGIRTFVRVKGGMNRWNREEGMKRKREPETLEQALEQFIIVVRADVARRRGHIEAMPSRKGSPEENGELVYITAGLMSSLSFLCDLVGKFLPVAEETSVGLEVMRLNDLERLSESSPGLARPTWH